MDNSLLNKIMNSGKSDLGELLFTMETVYGFPTEMSLEELKDILPNDINGFFNLAVSYLNKQTEHKIFSGVEFDGDKHDKIRDNNNRILSEILKGNLILK